MKTDHISFVTSMPVIVSLVLVAWVFGLEMGAWVFGLEMGADVYFITPPILILCILGLIVIVWKIRTES